MNDTVCIPRWAIALNAALWLISVICWVIVIAAH